MSGTRDSLREPTGERAKARAAMNHFGGIDARQKLARVFDLAVPSLGKATVAGRSIQFVGDVLLGLLLEILACRERTSTEVLTIERC